MSKGLDVELENNKPSGNELLPPIFYKISKERIVIFLDSG